MIRARRLAALLAIACVATQVVAGSALLASGVALALHAGDHEHSVSVVSGEGHVHVVLAHDPAGHRHRSGALEHEPAVAERDHVLEMNPEDAASASRRAVHDAAPPLTLALVVPSPPRLALPLLPAPSMRAHGADSVRTVVLRL